MQDKILSVKIKIDKGFNKLVRRTCKSLKSLNDDGLITAKDIDVIVQRVKLRLQDAIIVGDKKG